MKKIISLLLVAALMIPFGIFVSAEDVLFTSSFEEEMKGWGYQTTGSNLNVKITDTCATDGTHSIYIFDEATDAAYGVKSDMAEVTAGEAYSVSVDSYITEGSVALYIKYFDANKKQLFSKSARGKAGEWTNVVISEVAPADSAFIQLILCTSSVGTGAAYFDNARIIKGRVTPYTVTNGTIPSGKEDTTVDMPELDDFVEEENEIIFSESFENGIEGWGYHNAKLADWIEVRDDVVFAGKKAVFMTDKDEASAPGIKSSYIDIKAGEYYTVAAYFYKTTGSSIKLWLKFFDADKKALSTTSLAPKLDALWEEVACSGTAPEGAVYAQVLVAGIGANVGDAYTDDLRLYRGEYISETSYAPYVAPKQTAAIDAKIVAPVDNKLSYTPYTDKGDIIGDYSYAGFHGGDYELPVSANLPVATTLSPTGQDDTKLIQKAIDNAERKDGGINIVKLKAGTYYINTQGINIKSGVLLSGEGQGPTGTILYAYSPAQHIPVKISGSAPVESKDISYIQNDYLAAGQKTLNVSDSDINKYKVGDRIAICHNSTEAWAKAIGMHGTINVYDTDTSWLPDKVNMLTERIITKISGNEITLDFGIFVPHMKDLVPSYITKVDDSGKVENAGIENLRIVSYYNGNPKDEEHATTAISITNAKNIFVRDVTGKYFYSSVIASGRRAARVTARNVSCIEPVSVITGARRYSFASSTSAQQILYTGCYSHDGRHDFETSYSVTGPISYVDNVVDKGNTGTETHGTWSTGVLFDNIYHIGHDTKGYIAFSNRGNMGTQLSQGWTSASAIAWNCLSSTILVLKPPLTYQNFSVGVWGKYEDEAAYKMKDKYTESNKKNYRFGKDTYKDEYFVTDANTPFVGDAYKEAQYTPVEPRSLYKAQLSERYTGVISNARPNAPILVTPMADAETQDNNVTVTGVYQLGATAVTVYIDNNPYNATLKPETNEFEFTTTLNNGTHKIYVTQTINGIESNKNADRFIVIGDKGENYDYLQSIYSPDKVRMILNDPRPTYDEVINGIKVKVFGHLLYSDVSPSEINGRVLVPMRAIFEKLNADISWDGATATATAKKDGIEVKITENSTTAFVNGAAVTLDVPATIINGRFVVPVRFISESFGAKVGWIDETKTVTIE